MSKEYIEREALLKKLGDNNIPCNIDVYYLIKNAPAVDVQEVRHGKWIKIKGRFFSSSDGRGGNMVKCSECGEPSSCNFSTPYCSICGAKMDKE